MRFLDIHVYVKKTTVQTLYDWNQQKQEGVIRDGTLYELEFVFWKVGFAFQFTKFNSITDYTPCDLDLS